jgi:WG containing repeat
MTDFKKLTTLCLGVGLIVALTLPTPAAQRKKIRKPRQGGNIPSVRATPKATPTPVASPVVEEPQPVKLEKLLFPAVKDGKYGYIDSTGQMAIAATYDGTFIFREGLGRVKIGKKYGYVGMDGKLAIPAQFDRGSEFSDGLALISRNGKLGYVDRSGRVVIEQSTFTDATSFSDGMAVVRIGKKYGYIDRTGNLVIPATYKFAHPFQSGLGMALTEEGWVYLDKQGATKITQLSLEEQYIDARQRGFYPFSKDGLARILIDGKSGYINRLGKTAIKPQFTEAYTFTEGLAPVKVGDRYGYINTKGKLVIPAEYSIVSEFQSGLAAVQVGKQYGYINSLGKMVVEPRFDQAYSFNSELAAVVNNRRLGYIDRTGKLVWQAKALK